jgi:hypothetical protein
MKVGIVSNFPVGPRYNGGAMTVWGIYKAYKEKGFDTSLILLCEQNVNKKLFENCENFLKLNTVKYKIIFFNEEKKKFYEKIKNLIKSLIFKTPEYFFYDQFNLKNKIKNIFDNENFDKIICYHFDALSACYLNNNKNIICFMGDLMHEPRIAGRKLFKNNIILNSINKIEEIISMRITINLLSRYKNIGFCANHYTEIVKKKIPRTNYFRVPLISSNKIIEYNSQKNNINNILLIGDLSGTVTTSSLIYLKKFLNFTKEEIKQNFIFKIFGGGQIKQELKKLYDYKCIEFKGVNNDLKNEFNNSSILLVCNEITVGMRVRIITAMSYGLIILTHSSNLKGIPEIKHNKNVLVFTSKKELEDLILDIRESKFDLKKISEEALLTFNKYFSYKAAVEDLEKKLI